MDKAILEALKRTTTDKKKLEKEEETLIKSRGYVRRIHDEDIEIEEQLDPLSNGHGDSYNRKKIPENDFEKHNSLILISIIKKSVIASEDKTPPKTRTKGRK